MRPERPFRELLREALAAVREGDLEALRQEAFQREAQRHARLAPKGDDPVARALALGRQALWDLAQGNGEGACQKLSQALELHPFLGGGLAWELARVLCGRVGDAVSPPLGERRALLREPPPAARLLAFLDQLPPGFWAEALRGGGAASRAAFSQGDLHRPQPRAKGRRGGERPPSPRRPNRPRLTLVYRPLRRKEPRGKGETRPETSTFVSLGLLPQHTGSDWWEPLEAPSLRRWVGPGLEVREREDGGLRLWVLPEFWKAHPEAALLVLEAEGARALAFLLPTERPLPLPLDLEGGGDLVAEVWSWGDLTPEALAGLFREARFHLDLFARWLRYGTARGLISQEAVWEALRQLEWRG
ncbi:hypothetical protein [Thermus sp.]